MLPHRLSSKILLTTAVCLAALPLASETSQACEPFQYLETFTQADHAPSGSSCATYLSQVSSTGISCHWQFAYRDAAAEVLASKLWSGLMTCRAGQERAEDLPVNHPDSYFLRVWDVDTGVYRLSIKDKAALGATFVFLRFEGD